MFLAGMLYWAFQRSAFSGVPVMMPARRQFAGFCRAGAIWLVLREPRPHSATPSFLRDAAASARVRLVLMKGAAARAAACATNLRRVDISVALPPARREFASVRRKVQIETQTFSVALLQCPWPTMLR